MHLVQAHREHLASYVAALRTGWSADNLRGAAAAKEELEWIEAAPDDFLTSLYDPLGRRGPITLPDGSKVPRIPGYTRWMWDGEFCGSIGLRWVPGAQDVPPYVLGHVGYAVVPWKRGRGYARQALNEILPEAKAIGLSYVEMTTDPDNIASQRVIEANGGIFVEHFIKPQQFGSKPGLRFRITFK